MLKFGTDWIYNYEMTPYRGHRYKWFKLLKNCREEGEIRRSNMEWCTKVELVKKLTNFSLTIF